MGKLTVRFTVKDSAEFDELLRALADQIVKAHIHYQLYRDLHQSLYDHPLVLQQSNTFWNLTLNAHRNTSIQTPCRVYDQHAEALHLHSWLLTIQAHLHLFDQEQFRRRLKDNPFVESLVQIPRKPDQIILEEDIQLCSPHNPLVKTLLIHRHSHVAHANAKNILAKRNAQDSHPLTFEDFEALLTRADTILNRYSHLFAAVTYSKKIMGRDDYHYIFTSVEEKIQRDEEEIEKICRSLRIG